MKKLLLLILQQLRIEDKFFNNPRSCCQPHCRNMIPAVHYTPYQCLAMIAWNYKGRSKEALDVERYTKESVEMSRDVMNCNP